MFLRHREARAVQFGCSAEIGGQNIDLWPDQPLCPMPVLV